MKDTYEGLGVLEEDFVLPNEPPNSFYRKYGKRIFDFTLAVLLLPILAPVIAVLWMLVRRDGGTGFFGQERVGKHGKVYTCWKIRTMVFDAEDRLDEYLADNPDAKQEWDLNQKLAVDPRITETGQFLRRTSLDELPQIWNVLVGEMSFVGPRPFMVSQKGMYQAAGGADYFEMAPGITGPWQIEGRGCSTFVSRVRFDSNYLATIGLRKDVSLIWGTVGVVFRSTGG